MGALVLEPEVLLPAEPPEEVDELLLPHAVTPSPSIATASTVRTFVRCLVVSRFVSLT